MIKIAKKVLLFLGSVLIILLPSILNGYPVLFSDTGTYVLSGFKLFVPIDRPVVYGLFLGGSSFHLSLWISVFTQALLLNLFLLMVLKTIFRFKNPYLKLLILSIILTFATSMAYFANHMIPDIFSALVVIGLGIIIASPRSNLFLLSVVSLAVLFFNMMHLSNLLITMSLFGIWLIISLLFMKRKWIKDRWFSLVFLSAITAGSWLLLPTIHNALGGGFVTSRVKNIFMMGSLVEKDLIEPYLDAYCGERGYDLCRYKDVIGNSTEYFLWDHNSALYQGGCMEMGWDSCWIVKDKEFGRIITDLLATPEFRNQYFKIAFVEGFRQLYTIRIQNRAPEGAGSPVRYPMEVCFGEKEYRRYITAYQQENGLRFHVLSRINGIVTLISFIGILLFFSLPGLRKHLSDRIIIFSAAIFLALLANAYIVSVFSHVTARYQSRLAWIIVMIFAGYLFNYFQIIRMNGGED